MSHTQDASRPNHTTTYPTHHRSCRIVHLLTPSLLSRRTWPLSPIILDANANANANALGPNPSSSFRLSAGNPRIRPKPRRHDLVHAASRWRALRARTSCCTSSGACVNGRATCVRQGGFVCTVLQCIARVRLIGWVWYEGEGVE